jgi:enoyl-CoA hydratase/carnithine racemase
MISTSVIREIHGNVGVAILNRPDRLNAWTGEMQSQLFDTFEAYESDPNIRVIVVTGAGRGFCAGADLSGLNDLSEGRSQSSESSALTTPDKRSFLLPMHIKKPILAAVNGPVAGMGFGFALTCDMRFSNRDAKWCGAFSKRGLVAEWGTSFLLPRLIGTGNAMMFMMSSDIFLGDEAMRLGMVQKVFDGDVKEQTILYAQKLAGK